jgi:hypothetical protein
MWDWWSGESRSLPFQHLWICQYRFGRRVSLSIRWEVVLGHDAALARLLREIIDFRESSVLVVKASEAKTLVLDKAISTLRWGADSHAETLEGIVRAIL